MLRHNIDTTAEKFGDAVTIAHLALNSFEGCDSQRLSIYAADAILARDWSFELVNVEMEYGLGITAEFLDGSKLSVGAWWTEPRDTDDA